MKVRKGIELGDPREGLGDEAKGQTPEILVDQYVIILTSELIKVISDQRHKRIKRPDDSLVLMTVTGSLRIRRVINNDR